MSEEEKTVKEWMFEWWRKMWKLRQEKEEQLPRPPGVIYFEGRLYVDPDED